MKARWMMTAVVAGGLTAMASTAGAEPSARPGSFQTCSDVRDYLSRVYAQQVAFQLAYPLQPQYYGHDMPRSSAAPTAAEGKGAEAQSAPSNYTGTNVQVAGVDENDFVKTDGKYVYTLTGGQLSIVKSWPVDDAHVVGVLQLPQGVTPTSLLLNGDRLVVFSTIYETANPPDALPRGQHPYQQVTFAGTRVTIVDVSDRSAPRIDRQEDYEGYSSQARLIGSDVYFVTNSYLSPPTSLWDLDQYGLDRPKEWLPFEEQQKHVQRILPKVTAKVRALLERESIKELLPSHREVRVDGRVVSTQPMVACGDVYSAPAPSAGLVGVHHFDLDDPNDRGSAALTGDGWTVYASHDNLYIAGTTYGWGWFTGSSTWQDDWNRTTVHKFALRGDDGQPQYRATGRVDGWLLNQFSMSEYRGDLRIGTTDWDMPNRTDRGGNHLSILREKNGELVQIGSIRNLARGERIFSMRMMGEVGYMVTFRQTDPLFTLDLSNPKKPAVVGELKINGFSSYIHPLGPEHLLTVGQDADDQGRVLGLHLQIFDVSNLEKPIRTHHKRLSGDRWSSWSPAMWNHHAFTFDRTKNLLVLPVTSYSPEAYSGAMVLKADPVAGFEDFGFVTHNGKVGREWCESVYSTAPQNYGWAPCDEQNLVWQTTIQRTIVVDDYVVAIGNLGITTHRYTRPDKVVASVQVVKDFPKLYHYW